jgi:hypothetical protein
MGDVLMLLEQEDSRWSYDELSRVEKLLIILILLFTPVNLGWSPNGFYVVEVTEVECPILLHLFLGDLYLLNEFRDVLYDFIHFFGNFPVLLQYIGEQISPIVQRRLAERRQAE